MGISHVAFSASSRESQLSSRAVTVCVARSRLTHSTVSPECATTVAGANRKPAMVTRWRRLSTSRATPAGVSAAATAAAVTTAIPNRRIADGKPDRLPLQRNRIHHALRMLLMGLEDDEGFLKQCLHLGVRDFRDERLLDHFVDGVVVAQLVAGVALVEGAPAELTQLIDEPIRLVEELVAEGVVLRLDLELLEQREGPVVDSSMITDHRLSKGAHRRIFRYAQGQVRVPDVDQIRGVRNVRDLQIVQRGWRFGPAQARQGQHGGQDDEPDFSPLHVKSPP